MGINLFKHYKENIKDDDYYSTFKSNINYYSDSPFVVHDEVHAIARFRELCYPPEQKPANDTIEFLLICYFLKNKGYEIEQFPNQLERPANLYDFSYKEFRSYLQLKNNYPSSTVPHKDRRILANELKFQLKNESLLLKEELDDLVRYVSIRNEDFNNMIIDEKLITLTNVLEKILKKDGKYIDTDEKNLFFGFINDKTIRAYRNKLHCFRHSEEGPLLERKSLTEKQKQFLLEFGLTILHAIYEKQD